MLVCCSDGKFGVGGATSHFPKSWKFQKPRGWHPNTIPHPRSARCSFPTLISIFSPTIYKPIGRLLFCLVLVVQMSVCIRGSVLELLGAIAWLPEGTQDPCEPGLFASALVSSSAMFCPLDNTRLSHGRHIPAGCWASQWTCWGSCRKLKAKKTTQQDEMQ